MRVRLLPVLLLVVVGGAGCHGPKSDCEGTMRSFEAIIDGNHWDDFPDIISPSQRAKYHDRAIIAWVSDYYMGAKFFKFKSLQASETGTTCLVQGVSDWEQKIRGKEPVRFEDEYVTYTLHQVDGKWYMDVPGSSKLQAF